MADWVAALKKYVPNPDDAAVEGMLKTYRLSLSNADAAYVSFSDKAELATVRDSFLKKKLGLTHSDEALDAAIAEVGEKMKDGSRNPRIAVYYLLAEKYNKLGMFKN